MCIPYLSPASHSFNWCIFRSEGNHLHAAIAAGGSANDDGVRLVAEFRAGCASHTCRRHRTVSTGAYSDLKEIIYTPPSPQEVPPMMTEFVSWLNSEQDVHPILVAGIAQFQLVHIQI